MFPSPENLTTPFFCNTVTGIAGQVVQSGELPFIVGEKNEIVFAK